MNFFKKFKKRRNINNSLKEVRARVPEIKDSMPHMSDIDYKKYLSKFYKDKSDLEKYYNDKLKFL